MPYTYRGGGEAKVGAAEFGQRPLSSTRDAQPMKQSTEEAERLAGPRRPGGNRPDCLCRTALVVVTPDDRNRFALSRRCPTFVAHAASRFDPKEWLHPFL